MAMLAVGLLLCAGLPAAQASEAPLPPLGINQGSVKAMADAGVPVMYGSFWVGWWTASSGWGGPDNALKSAKATGVTPVIYWYYWGDDISPSCVENSCKGKNKPQWDSMTVELAEHIRTIMGGQRTIVVLENEFNKQGISDSWYAPTFDRYLEEKAAVLHTVPGVEVVLGFGAWGEDSWHRFPRAIAASDTIGFQLMRASTRDSEATYRDSPDKIARVLQHIKGMGGHGAFLYDVALSSYEGEYWTKVQAETLAAIMKRLPEYQANGLQGLVYRELIDNPSMGTWNYFGIAEQYWGFRTTSGVDKPSLDAWRLAYGPQTPPPPPQPNLPGRFEGEAMSATTGGRQGDSAASGGAAWNLWTNGELRQSLVAETAGEHRITVTARGSSAGGVDARMELRLNGKAIAAHSVSSAGYRTYTADVSLPAGASAFAVAFTNDAIVNGVDRNLYVDVVDVRGVAVNRAPTASFLMDGEERTVRLDASPSSDPDGDALAYTWSLGDGRTATGARVTHTYAADGAFPVTLTVSDGRLKDDASQTFAAKANRAPVAQFTVAGADLAWRFDGSGSRDADGDALTYAWTFGDGGSATGATASRSYASAGRYAVTLTVSDGRLSSTATQMVDATAPKPVAFEANFRPVKGNDWWVQTAVGGNMGVSAVCASVNNGACQPLKLQSWGEWAASFHVPAGSKVVFTATGANGQKATSGAYAWPTAQPYTEFTAEFRPTGNNWWIQTPVKASQPVASVCASVNGGACQPLKLQSWGEWAASFKIPSGSSVVVKATSTAGQTTASAPVKWA